MSLGGDSYDSRSKRFWSWGRVLSLYVVLAILVGAGWLLIAPRAQCYAPEGTCLFFAGEMSNVFFRIDATFALLALAAGVASGMFLNGRWLSRGFRFQVLAALATTGLSVLVTNVVELLVTPTVLAASKPDFLDNVLFLGAQSAWLIWAFGQQLTFAISGPKHER